jgi:hypothetical protein
LATPTLNPSQTSIQNLKYELIEKKKKKKIVFGPIAKKVRHPTLKTITNK